MKTIDAIKAHLENIEVEVEQLRKIIKKFSAPGHQDLLVTFVIGKAKHLVQTHTKLEEEIK